VRFKIVRYQRLTGTPPEIRPRPGLGDRIAKVAKPIARRIDRVLGTNLKECKGCEDRVAWLNKHFPL